MYKAQFYSNVDFNRAVELREVEVTVFDIIYIPIFNNAFFVTEFNNTVVMIALKELVFLSERKYFLGVENEKEIWCIDLSEIEFSTVCNFLPKSKLSCVRDFFHLVTEKEASLLAYARGVSIWNNTHQFCNNCGSRTIIQEKGHSRKCENKACILEHFPRINPAVIVLIEYKPENSEPLCLLNMRKAKYGYLCSLFSGFSEIGESLEDTVKREMKEEVHVTVNNIKYIASQPWSFPASIMFGFSAVTKSKSFKVDNKEIKEAQWFSANQIKEMVAKNQLLISKKDSISNSLIESWVEQNS